MLETVKSCIKSLPDVPFTQFFNSYIISTQDSNIEYELNYIFNHNVVNVNIMDIVIQQTHERLINICSATQNSNLHM